MAPKPDYRVSNEPDSISVRICQRHSKSISVSSGIKIIQISILAGSDYFRLEIPGVKMYFAQKIIVNQVVISGTDIVSRVEMVFGRGWC